MNTVFHFATSLHDFATRAWTVVYDLALLVFRVLGTPDSWLRFFA
jgi:hypothetical protein